jgi:tetratricopeptide (TPR) repeat protein
MEKFCTVDIYLRLDLRNFVKCKAEYPKCQARKAEINNTKTQTMINTQLQFIASFVRYTFIILFSSYTIISAGGTAICIESSADLIKEQIVEIELEKKTLEEEVKTLKKIFEGDKSQLHIKDLIETGEKKIEILRQERIRLGRRLSVKSFDDPALKNYMVLKKLEVILIYENRIEALNKRQKKIAAGITEIQSKMAGVEGNIDLFFKYQDEMKEETRKSLQCMLEIEQCESIIEKLKSSGGLDRRLEKDETIFQIKKSINTVPLSVESSPLNTLFEATRNRSLAQGLNLNEYIAKTDKNDPEWPLYQFLGAECFRLRGDHESSIEIHRNLAMWAADDPYSDGLGGSAVATLSMWRWIEFLYKETTPTRYQVETAIETLDKLRKTRFFKGVFNASDTWRIWNIVDLPQVEEKMLRCSSQLAMKTGLTEKADEYFLAYFKIAKDDALSLEERNIYRRLTDTGKVKESELQFMRVERLIRLGRDEQAKKILQEMQSYPSHLTRLEALYILAELTRKQNKTKTRKKVVEILDTIIDESTDPELTQKALYLRCKTLFREGAGRDELQALKDMNTMIRRFPEGNNIDDALYFIARYYQQQKQVQNALEYYEKLRNLTGRHDWINLSRLEPALILYAQDKFNNRNQIQRMLVDLLRVDPNGPFHLTACFWLGRLSEETERKNDAQRWFHKIIEKSPYDYYAIRSRYHLNTGRNASHLLWPDYKTKHQLADAYQNSRIAVSMNKNSKYYHRIHLAIETGLYTMALNGETLLRKIFPSKRPSVLEPEDLEKSGLFSSYAILISLRQDALAANINDKRLNSRLQIASSVGLGAGDWPISLAISGYSSKAQKDDRFLTTAYPPVYIDLLMKAGSEYTVSPALLYSVVREESSFYPSAMSYHGALGLFQFMPSTFSGILKKYPNDIDMTGMPSKEAFMLDPERTTRLGGFWFGRILHKSQEGNVLYSIMEHHAGYPAVLSWRKNLRELGLEMDVEYAVESVRFGSTRRFVKSVLRNMAIIDASGVFKK